LSLFYSPTVIAESNIAALASAGVIGSLHAVQQNDKLRRQRCDVVLQEACASLRRMAAEGRFAISGVPAADAALVEVCVRVSA
jgi:hypothetical protein